LKENDESAPLRILEPGRQLDAHLAHLGPLRSPAGRHVPLEALDDALDDIGRERLP
jgi:hypothetical protein